MKYLKTFEALKLTISEDDYVKFLAKHAVNVFKEDTDWKDINTWKSIESALDIDSSADNSLNHIFGEYSTRMLDIAMRDFKKYLFNEINKYGKDVYENIYNSVPYGREVTKYLIDIACKFPLLRMEEDGKDNLRTDINYFFKTKPKIVSNWNLISQLHDIFSNFINEGIETNDIYFESFLETYIKGVYPKIKKIIERNPTYLSKLENIECTINVPEKIVDMIKNEKDWLGRGFKAGLMGLKN